MNCLVIIDVQKGLLVDDSTSAIPHKIKELVASNKFDFIVATQFKNAMGSPFDKIMGWNGMSDGQSQELALEIKEIASHCFVKKVYSCFTEEFVKFIRDNNIDKLYFTGIDIDACVLKSALDCFERNINLEVLINYCATSGGEKNFKSAVSVLEFTLGEGCINRVL